MGQDTVTTWVRIRTKWTSNPNVLTHSIQIILNPVAEVKNLQTSLCFFVQLWEYSFLVDEAIIKPKYVFHRDQEVQI